MTNKERLTDTCVVEYRCGRKRIFVRNFDSRGDVFLSIDGDLRFAPLSNYYDDLTHIFVKELDIMKISKLNKVGTKIDLNDTQLVWSRQDDEIEQIKEFCKKMGFTIKIIG